MWTYNTSLKWKGGEAADLIADEKPTLNILPPEEFGGRKDHWSPEDLLVGAVDSCLLLTTRYFVEKMGINMTTYESNATGRMERTPNGLRFQGIDIEVRAGVGSPEDESKMKKAVALAEKYCPVSSAVNCPVGVSVQTWVERGQAA